MDEGSGSGVQRKSTSPKETCNLSTQKFTDIVNTAAFVDKSLFIKAFFERQNSMIVTLAPGRFGKSTNMDMLKEFLSGNKKLFIDNKLKIWEEERTFFNENCRKNPIIHVDFKDVEGNSEGEVLGSIKRIIQRAYGDHKYLVKRVRTKWTWSDEDLEDGVDFTIEKFMKHWRHSETLSRDEVICGFECLCQCLYVYHGKPVYALIDEYDAPIMNALMKTNPGAVWNWDGTLDDTIYLISNIMSSFLKGNKYMKGALINATVRIAELSRGANNIEYYEFLKDHAFAPYYGFTDEEVQDLLEREEFETLRNSKDDIQKWYNGHQVMNTKGDAIYSSYSVLKFLQESRRMKKPMFDCYWFDTGNIANVKPFFANGDIRELVEELINGEEVEICPVQTMTKEDIKTLMTHCDIDLVDTDLFLQFLSDNGYLNMTEHSTECLRSTVKVPNLELNKHWRNIALWQRNL